MGPLHCASLAAYVCFCCMSVALQQRVLQTQGLNEPYHKLAKESGELRLTAARKGFKEKAMSVSRC
eukprot:1160463-Pelagomonas_calceolata.AAC.2